MKTICYVRQLLHDGGCVKRIEKDAVLVQRPLLKWDLNGNNKVRIVYYSHHDFAMVFVQHLQYVHCTMSFNTLAM